MNDAPQLLIINVGSTSTKVAFFKGLEPVVQDTIGYSAEELSRLAGLQDQLPRRRDDLDRFVEKNDNFSRSARPVCQPGRIGETGACRGLCHR